MRQGAVPDFMLEVYNPQHAMLTPPYILTIPFERAAIIRLIVPRNDLPHHLPIALAELLATLTEQRLSPTGPAFAHYLRITPTHFDLELGLPVVATVRPSGRVDPGQLPAATVARAIHHGPWSLLPAAWSDLDRWLLTQPHTPARTLWERYLTDAESTADPSQHRTELNRPLHG